MNGLIRLGPEHYEAFRRLIPNGIGHRTFALGVLEGRMAGQVWADAAESPETAIVMSDADFCLAIGMPRADLIAHSLPAMRAANRADKPELWATTHEWALALAFLGPSRQRNEYEFEGLPENARRRALPKGFRLASIDAAVARLFRGAVDPWVVEVVWGGPDQFVERAFGWAILAPSGELASFCATCAIGGGEAEVEIGTNDAYRRQGLALVAGARFITECLERGLVPAWTCATGNAGSERLAELLGFRFVRQVTGYPLA